MSTPITLTGAYTCTHHNDKQRTECPVCLVATLRARADRAEAELATERARLDWLQAQEVKRGLEITEGHDDPLPFLVLDEDGTTHWGVTYRAAIDAAMKEETK